jgi:hypothetical protein
MDEYLHQYNKTVNSGILKCCLFNPRSVKNKALSIMDYCIEFDLDMLLLTETWLFGNIKDDVILSDLVPPNYDIFHQARQGEKGQGGGLALIHKKGINITCITNLRGCDSFEHMEVKCIYNNISLNVLIVYRPPL